MAKAYCTGPVSIFAGVGDTAKTPVFLGHGETAPDIDIKAEWDTVMNDLAGSKLPFDRLFEGEEGMISAVLTRWNWVVLKRMMTRPNFLATNPGISLSGDIGTLMGQEGMTYPVWCKFPYAAKAAFGADMPAGVRFRSCMLLSPDKIAGGNRAKKISIVIQAQRSFDIGSTGSNVPGGGTFQLYDYNMAGLPAID